MNSLVIGGAGFIENWIIEPLLVEVGHNVTVPPSITTGRSGV